MVEAEVLGHIVPLLVKGTRVLLSDVLEQIVAMSGTPVAAQALPHHFPSLIIHHAFMGHFLVSVSSIGVHLVPLCDPVPPTVSSLRLILVSLLYKVPILVLLCRGYALHLGKFAFPTALTTMRAQHLHRFSYLAFHITPHLADHLVYLTERFLKERIVGEWISSKILQHHIIGHLFLMLHHYLSEVVTKGASTPTPIDYLVIAVMGTTVFIGKRD